MSCLVFCDESFVPFWEDLMNHSHPQSLLKKLSSGYEGYKRRLHQLLLSHKAADPGNKFLPRCGSGDTCNEVTHPVKQAIVHYNILSDNRAEYVASNQDVLVTQLYVFAMLMSLIQSIRGSIHARVWDSGM